MYWAPNCLGLKIERSTSSICDSGLVRHCSEAAAISKKAVPGSIGLSWTLNATHPSFIVCRDSASKLLFAFGKERYV